ncbi:hypothetical protein HOC06_01355 [Candidatus Woesearchaeota archaeon]|nr:hypothetical protein [Candidatus Woesearchaeota archaeon]MBT4630852.1 hypothetical protein [Candidatus Woesearchaeota archaeon]
MNIFNKWLFWVVLIFIIIFWMLSPILYDILILPIHESNINGEIDDANYCNVKEDCVSFSGKCPFGCYVSVNVNEEDRIRKLVDSYQPKSSFCEYSCAYCTVVDCIDNKCEILCPGGGSSDCLADGENCHLQDACEERCCSGGYTFCDSEPMECEGCVPDYCCGFKEDCIEDGEYCQLSPGSSPHCADCCSNNYYIPSNCPAGMDCPAGPPTAGICGEKN